MHDRSANQLLRQIPLTVSPFIHIPAAVTLPYAYESLPRGLPHASTEPSPPPGDSSSAQGYIKSPSGNVATTPQDIIGNCQDLMRHLQCQTTSAELNLAEWERTIEERDLMEKRRVAPGYLDTGLRILEPTRRGIENTYSKVHKDTEERERTGDELDRVFGKMSV